MPVTANGGSAIRQLLSVFPSILLATAAVSALPVVALLSPVTLRYTGPRVPLGERRALGRSSPKHQHRGRPRQHRRGGGAEARRGWYAAGAGSRVFLWDRSAAHHGPGQRAADAVVGGFGSERNSAGRTGPVHRGRARRDRGRVGSDLPGPGPEIRPADPGLVPRPDALGLRLGELSRRPVLLSGRPQGVSRSGFLSATRGRVPGARAVRPGVCARARSGPSRAEPARHRRPGARCTGAGIAGAGKPTVGETGAAG